MAQCGVALEYASEEPKNHKEAVLAAVAQHGRALGYASITQGEFRTYVRGRHAAYRTCDAFLLAARPHANSLRAAPAPRPASWVLDGIGEDASRHVQCVRRVAMRQGVGGNLRRCGELMLSPAARSKRGGVGEGGGGRRNAQNSPLADYRARFSRVPGFSHIPIFPCAKHHAAARNAPSAL